MAVAVKKPKETPRQVLCRELLEIRSQHSLAFLRIDAINTELKAIAGKEGKFRETFVGLGYVSVSPEKPEETIGEQPVAQVAAWNQLPNHRQQKLLEQGLVKIEPIVKGASYGRVTAKLHAEE